jgi:hypothetical protein
MTDHKAPYLPPAEIDALRLKAFRTNNANDISAYNRQVSLYFQYRMDRELDRSYRIKELEAENKRLKSMVADVINDTGDDPEIMAASRAEWAARALEAEAKLVEYKMIAGAIDKRWAESEDEVAELEAKLAELEPKDGRPCATDEFLAVILDELDDNWDIFEAIKDWVEGDWVNAVQGTALAELKGEK